MSRPSNETIHNVLHGLATPNESELVAKWFAAEEGQTYLSELMDDFFHNINEGFEEIYIPAKIPTDNIWEKITQTISPNSESIPLEKIVSFIDKRLE